MHSHPFIIMLFYLEMRFHSEVFPVDRFKSSFINLHIPVVKMHFSDLYQNVLIIITDNNFFFIYVTFGPAYLLKVNWNKLKQ